MTLRGVGGGTPAANRGEDGLVGAADDSHRPTPGTPRPKIALERRRQEKRRADHLVRKIGQHFDQLTIVGVALFRRDAEHGADDHLQGDRLRHAMHRELGAGPPRVDRVGRSLPDLLEVHPHPIAVELRQHQLSPLPMRRLVHRQHRRRAGHRTKDAEVRFAGVHGVGRRREHRLDQCGRRQHDPRPRSHQSQREDVAKPRGALVEQRERVPGVAVRLKQGGACRARR